MRQRPLRSRRGGAHLSGSVVPAGVGITKLRGCIAVRGCRRILRQDSPRRRRSSHRPSCRSAWRGRHLGALIVWESGWGGQLARGLGGATPCAGVRWKRFGGGRGDDTGGRRDATCCRRIGSDGGRRRGCRCNVRRRRHSAGRDLVRLRCGPLRGRRTLRRPRRRQLRRLSVGSQVVVRGREFVRRAVVAARGVLWGCLDAVSSRSLRQRRTGGDVMGRLATDERGQRHCDRAGSWVARRPGCCGRGNRVGVAVGVVAAFARRFSFSLFMSAEPAVSRAWAKQGVIPVSRASSAEEPAAAGLAVGSTTREGIRSARVTDLVMIPPPCRPRRGSGHVGRCAPVLRYATGGFDGAATGRVGGDGVGPRAEGGVELGEQVGCARDRRRWVEGVDPVGGRSGRHELGDALRAGRG